MEGAMPRTVAGGGVSVASRVLAILGSFDAGHRALTLSEIARRSGLTLTPAGPTSGQRKPQVAPTGGLAL
jgi:hypothetical protein